MAISIGLQAAQCLHSNTGAPTEHCQRYLEDAIRVQEPHASDAVQHERGWRGGILSLLPQQRGRGCQVWEDVGHSAGQGILHRLYRQEIQHSGR